MAHSNGKKGVDMADFAQGDERQEPQRKMTRAEAGRKGGMKTRQRYGNDFFRKIGRIGGKKGGARIRTQ